MRREALGGATDDNGDGLPLALLQDVAARRLAHGANAQRQKHVAVERDGEIGTEGEKMWYDPWECFREARA